MKEELKYLWVWKQVLRYALTSRPCSAGAALRSQVFEALWEDRVCTSMDWYTISPRENWTRSSVIIHICPCCPQQMLCLLSFQKKMGEKRERNRNEKPYLTKSQRLSPGNWVGSRQAASSLPRSWAAASWTTDKEAGLQCNSKWLFSIMAALEPFFKDYFPYRVLNNLQGQADDN